MTMSARTRLSDPMVGAVLALGITQITAWGTSSPRTMVQAWLRSPPHRAIMLDPRYRVAGAYVGHDFGRVVFGSASE